MKYAYFDPNQGGKVLQWIDTEAANYNLPDKTLLHACTDDEWQLDQSHEWAVSDGSVIPYVPSDVPAEHLVAALLRIRRDAALDATDWLAQRHRDEIEMQRPTTLTAGQFADLLGYRALLRDLPQSEGFPNVDLPAAPASLTDALVKSA